ncbi:hypothetical protein Cni_G06854 [Canna indica]|uniref:Uncharacterized protein n=1 Tax=Canna indica TaxID=4628 RepID=A0AAQ3JZD8_9LILI|nr:hypothetical protein Cni_G06854 [Canna indica]
MDHGERRELPSACELDEETIARKRSRRVSFAETTAVHVFDRDEDDETPPDSKPQSAYREAAGSRGDLSDSDDSRGSLHEDEDDDDDDGEQERFVRDMDSSSPGSAVGSVTSNDDDNFFGPVSTSFIRSTSLSEAEMSDASNHDITLDSTAFSLHFRNIAPADDRTANSVRSIMTPTEVTAPDNTSSLIVPTGFKKPFVCSRVFSADPGGSVDDSSNMSLVEDKSKNYDYAKLTTNLEKILNEVDRSIQPKSPNSSVKVALIASHSSEASGTKKSGENERQLGKEAGLDATHDNNFDSHILESSGKDTAIKLIVSRNPPKESLQLDTPISKGAMGTTRTMGKDIHEDDCGTRVPDKVVTPQKFGKLSPLNKGLRINSPLPSDHIPHSSYHDQLSGNKYFSVISPHPYEVVPSLVMEDGQQRRLEPEVGIYTPKSSPKFFQAPLLGSVSSLRAKRQRLFLDPAVTLQSKMTNNSAKQQPPSSLELELTRHGERISAIKNRISKFRIVETEDHDNLQSAISLKGHLLVDLEGTFEKEADISKENCMPVSTTNLEEKILTSIQKKKANTHIFESKRSRFAGPENATESTQDANENNMLLIPLTSSNITERVSDLETHVGSHSENMFNESSEVPSTLGSSAQQLVTVENDLARKKRRIEQHLDSDESQMNKISRMEKSPKISGELVANIPVIHPNHHAEVIDKSLDISGNSTVKHWPDIFSKVSEVIKVVFSPTIHKLSVEELGILENFLGDLQMARKYMRISTALKNNDLLNNLHQQRVHEVLHLQDKFLYEQAKMQIKHAKLDQLRNKTQLAQSGLKECRNLKSLFSHVLSPSTEMENHDPPVSSISSCQNQEEHESLASMKLELKMLEQKVDHMVKSFEVCYKMKGNMDLDEILKVANEHLETRTRTSIIHQHLRIWELSDIANRDNYHDIVLNYCNQLIQRFTIKRGEVSSIIVSNTLNEANIRKTFQNMNACVAFEYVFGDKDDRRVASSKYFQQKTLETSLLIGSLLDVLDEVKVAGMEILNLTLLNFSCSATSQLELKLCFTNFKSGRKVTLSIDLSELKCAVYPSDPSELKYKICETQTTLPPALLDKIIAVLKSMQGERPVILRLCRSISQLVQDSAS